jgi:hypothetical protein
MVEFSSETFAVGKRLTLTQHIDSSIRVGPIAIYASAEKSLAKILCSILRELHHQSHWALKRTNLRLAERGSFDIMSRAPEEELDDRLARTRLKAV